MQYRPSLFRDAGVALALRRGSWIVEMEREAYLYNINYDNGTHLRIIAAEGHSTDQ